jgi:hypothetical protein
LVEPFTGGPENPPDTFGEYPVICDETLTDVNPQHLSTAPGMAFFAGTGPEGKYCKDCKHKGYERLKVDSYGNAQRAVTHGGCAKFKQLLGVDGPQIKGSLPSCKYFEAKAD